MALMNADNFCKISKRRGKLRREISLGNGITCGNLDSSTRLEKICLSSSFLQGDAH